MFCCKDYYQKGNVCVGKFLSFFNMIYYPLLGVDEYEVFEQHAVGTEGNN